MKIDWNSGSWRSRPDAPEKNLRITIAGDWAPRFDYEKRMIEDPAGIWGDLLPAVQTGDVRIVNVETVLGDKGSPGPKDGPPLRADERTAEVLKVGGFHIASMANNHTLDYGIEGLSHTMKVLSDAGMETVGAGATCEEAARPLIYEAKGVKIGIISCAEGEESRARDGGPGAYGLVVDAVERQIRDLKQQADVVLVIFHGGRERAPLPPPYAVDESRRFAEAGATAVIGHHPHVPQGIEIHNGVPIVYSLGNFMFYFPTEYLFHHLGYLLHLDLAGRELVGFEITPYQIMPNEMREAKGATRKMLLADLENVSAMLGDPQKVRDVWDAFVDVDFGGCDGMIDLLARHIDEYRKDPSRGASLFLNLFYTPAHRELFIRGLYREANGESGASPQWAQDLVARWTKFPLTDLPESL